jgi:hypothetical protein
VIARAALRVTAVAAAVALAAFAIHLGVASRASALTPSRAGALGWPFQGTASVATAHERDWKASFGPATRRWVLGHRAYGNPLVQVGAPHALFASHYTTRPLDVVVVVAPLAGATPYVGIAGIYGSDSGHHGFDAVVPFRSFDQDVSGNARSYVRHIVDLVTVVVGGPRAGGLLVNADGVRQNVNDLPGLQYTFDNRGITWMYASVSFTFAHPTDGVITLTDGNGNLSNVLYHGPIGAGGVLG